MHRNMQTGNKYSHSSLVQRQKPRKETTVANQLTQRGHSQVPWLFYPLTASSVRY